MIEIRNLHHQFAASHVTALRLHALTVPKGSFVLVSGASGAGKTTLFHILAGLLRPTAGDVLIGGTNLYGLDERARDRHRARSIGYLMQEPAWLDSLTAEENVMLPMLFAGMPAKAMRLRARELLTRFGLERRVGHRPRALSTGERVRVALARALSVDPPVLLADEPTASLDADNARRTATLLSSLAKEQGKAVLIATHDRTLLEYADGEVLLAPARSER